MRSICFNTRNRTDCRSRAEHGVSTIWCPEKFHATAWNFSREIFLVRAQAKKSPLLEIFSDLCRPEACFASSQNSRGGVAEISEGYEEIICDHKNFEKISTVEIFSARLATINGVFLTINFTRMSSYLFANAYSAFSPAYNAASAVCSSNGQQVACPTWLPMAGAAFWVIILAIILITIISLWKIFTKAGQPGWASIIPIYSSIVTIQIAKKPTWWIILMFIPLVNIVMGCIVAYNLAKVFGKGGGFAAGLIILPVIFYPILAFGSAQYLPASPASPAPQPTV
jgi:hypothetical protein